MQLYFPNFLSRQGAIGFFDYLLESRIHQEDPNIIFNSDLNLQNWSDKVGGNLSIESMYIKNEKNLFSFFGFILENMLNCQEDANDCHGQLFQDLYVLWKLKNKTHGIFVEVGTGYPSGGNNTWNLESNFKWAGVCIEPNPFFHNNILKKRKSPLETRAIYHEDNVQITLVSPKNFEPGTGILENLELHHSGIPEVSPENFNEINVETISLINCLKHYSISNNFDYLSYDTTGNIDDIASIESILKIGYRPKIITTGHNYKSHRHLLHNMLKSYGYSREFEYLSKWDDWYYYNTI